MIPRFTISIVCFNNLDLTKECLASVLKYSKDFEIIITNNASSDGTEVYLASLRSNPNIKVVSNGNNLGFINPNNHALTLARGEFFVCLNNDLTVCNGWLEKLSEPFSGNPKMAITGISNTCRVIGENLVGKHHPNKTEYIEGSCLMIPTALARRHGLFSSYLDFAYWEDADLSLRLQELGYQIKTVDLPMNHKKRGSTSKMVNIRPFLNANTETMKKRFGFYFKRREFKRRILIRRLGARGDVLLTTPALRALRNKYPQAEIQIVTKCPQMLTGFDGVSIARNKTSWFDEFIDLDLAYEKRPEVHIVQAFADALDVPLPKPWKLEMFPTQNDLAWGERTSRGARVALIHGGMTTWPSKNWPVDRMEEVVKVLNKRGYLTIAVGSEGAPECGCQLSVAGSTSPQQLYALALHSTIFIGIDSMPQHVASAANLSSVVLFGPTNPKCIIRPHHRIIPVYGDQAQVPCIGEHGRRKIPVTQSPCDGSCIRAITPDMVLRAVDRLEKYV